MCSKLVSYVFLGLFFKLLGGCIHSEDNSPVLSETSQEAPFCKSLGPLVANCVYKVSDDVTYEIYFQHNFEKDTEVKYEGREEAMGCIDAIVYLKGKNGEIAHTCHRQGRLHFTRTSKADDLKKMEIALDAIAIDPMTGKSHQIKLPPTSFQEVRSHENTGGLTPTPYCSPANEDKFWLCVYFDSPTEYRTLVFLKDRPTTPAEKEAAKKVPCINGVVNTITSSGKRSTCHKKVSSLQLTVDSVSSSELQLKWEGKAITDTGKIFPENIPLTTFKIVTTNNAESLRPQPQCAFQAPTWICTYFYTPTQFLFIAFANEDKSKTLTKDTTFTKKQGKPCTFVRVIAFQFPPPKNYRQRLTTCKDREHFTISVLDVKPSSLNLSIQGKVGGSEEDGGEQDIHVPPTTFQIVPKLGETVSPVK